MMKKLLLFTSLLFFIAVNTNAQDKVWDFGNDTTNWPEDPSGESENVVRDNLGLYPGDEITNLGVIESSPKTWEDGYVGENRFKLNGGGSIDPTNDEFMPEQRFVYFAVDGDVTIDIWFRTGGSGTRTLYITDGSAIVGELSADNTDPIKLSASYTGGPTNLYIFGSNSCNLYKIEVTGNIGTTTTLDSTNDPDVVWDFGNDTTNWPEDPSGESENIVRDNLGLYPGDEISNFAVIESSPKTWEDGYVGENRFKLNGGGSIDPTNDEFMPEQRFVYFAVDGDVTIDIWFRTGGSGTRTLYITDGSAIVGELSADNTDPIKLSASYTGGPTNLYIFGSNSCNLYKIEVTGDVGTTSTLGVEKYKNTISTNIKAAGDRIYITDVQDKTEVNIYDLTGRLVKSFTTQQEMDFNFRSGLWIATLKNSKGQKSTKLLVK